MFCKICGTELKEGQKFCPKCGTPVEASGGSGPSENGQQTGQYDQTRQMYQQSFQEYQSQSDIPGKNDAIASMVLGIVAILFWFLGWSSVISIILGIVGLVLASNAKKKGYTEGIQTAGFVLSMVSLFGGILVFIACAACTGFTISILSLPY